MASFQPIFRIGLMVCLTLLFVGPILAQQQDTTVAPVPDSLQQAAPNEPGGPAGSGPASARPNGETSSDNAVHFSARDSLVIETDSAKGNQGTLHGEAEMSYQDASLQANTIEMDFESSQLKAYGAPSDTASLSRPRFQQGQQQSFTGETLSYNLETERGRVVSARTQQQEGFVQGQAVKVFEDSTLFVQDGSYTTCDCPPDETPSYSLRSNQMKIDGRWVYTGPIHLYLFNIPTPLWLPFGFLPNVQGRRSGPLPPNYGQDRRKGLFLKDWGWYFAMNDYMDLQLQASVWSQGSFEINPIFRYSKRYQYQGNFNLRYQRERIGEEEDPNFQNRHSGQLRWRHSQDLNPTSSLQGNINLTTSSDFARRNSENYNDAVRQDISSSLRYNKNWPGGGQNLSISANQQQQLQSGNVSLTLPNLNFNQRSFKPFERDQSFGDERWYEKITTSYDFSVRNQFSYNPRDPAQLRQRGDSTLADSIERAGIDWYEALVDREKYQLATGNDDPFDLQAQHSIPLSASFRVNRYNLNLSPQISYDSNWHISTQRLSVQRDSVNSRDSVVVQRTEPGFYARHDFSTSFSSNTELYGLFPVEVGPFQGLRHRMSPSLSLNYRPNFNDPFWGRTRILRYENGEPVLDDRTGEPLRYDILDGRVVRGSNEQRSLSFSLNNELETKHVRVDSTGEPQENKIKLLDFDLSTSYNFAADSLKLSDVSLRARTKIERFSIRSNMTFSPYALEPRARNTGSVRYRLADRYLAAENPFTPLRLTRFSLSVNGSVRNAGDQGSSRGMTSGRRGQRGGAPPQGRPSQAPPQAGQPQGQQGAQSTGPQPSSGYADFSLPWSLSFDFRYSFRRPAKEIENQNATLNANFDLNVTPLWSLEGRTGYDFIQNKLATTRIRVNRDLGCWVMSFSWVPFGRHQQYSFNLRVKSGQLSQLLQLQIPNSGTGSQLGGFGDQLRGAAGGLSGGGGFGGRRGGF